MREKFHKIGQQVKGYNARMICARTWNCDSWRTATSVEQTLPRAHSEIPRLLHNRSSVSAFTRAHQCLLF